MTISNSTNMYTQGSQQAYTQSNDGNSSSDVKNDKKESVSIFAKLDTNKNNNIEKSEASGTISNGFKDNSTSIFNNVLNNLQGLTSEDKSVLESKSESLKAKVSVKDIFSKISNSFTEISLVEVNKGDDVTQEKLDNYVDTQLKELINKYNEEASAEYESKMTQILEQSKNEVQQNRIENTYAQIDTGRDHSVDASEANVLLNDSELGSRFTKLNQSPTPSLNVSDYLTKAMNNFQTVNAQETVQDTKASFESRVNSEVNSNLSKVITQAMNNYQTDMSNLQKLENTNTHSNDTDMQESVKDNLETLGAKFTKINVNGSYVDSAVFQDNNGTVQNVVINEDGSTSKLERTDNGSGFVTTEINRAVNDKLDDLMNLDNAKLKNGNVVTYTDNDNRNHQTTVDYQLNADGTAKSSDHIVSSDNEEAKNNAYNRSLHETGLSQTQLKELGITPEVKNNNLIFKLPNGNIISTEVLMKLVQNGGDEHV